MNPADELAKRRLLRCIAAESAKGRDAEEIADSHGVTVEALRRMLRQARLDREVLERGPREVALEYAVGDITREEMLSDLGSRDYTYGYSPKPDSPISDAYVRGTWDEVVGAVVSRLITEADYHEIRRRVEVKPD